MTFAIRSRGGIHPHLPVPLLDGMQTTTDLELIMEPQDSTTRYAHMFEPGQARLGGFFLPPFQRPLVWSDEQKVRFVESALLGVSLGTIVVVDASSEPMRGPEMFARTDKWLLDGQQRISALLAYRNDEIEPFAGTECAHRWSDLDVVEKRRVWHVQIGVYKIRTSDEAYCREIYNRMNFGGVAHAEDQRA